MKNLKTFEIAKITKTNLSNLLGGCDPIVYETDGSFPTGDTDYWTDNDGDGKVSPGDTICW